VQTVLRSLPSLQQEICRQLMAGESITDIADSLGCGWHTVRRAVNDIRAAFIDAGIDQ
jgi:DNA-binding NarL/FixJ family response regulator